MESGTPSVNSSFETLSKMAKNLDEIFNELGGTIPTESNYFLHYKSHDPPSCKHQFWSTISGRISGGLVFPEVYFGHHSSSVVQ
jgi:hypothetical protein